jgi:ABC-type cobalamin/Fe3+-siderophores transport system ATPase subunit
VFQALAGRIKTSALDGKVTLDKRGDARQLSLANSKLAWRFFSPSLRRTSQVFYGGKTAKHMNVHRLVGYVDQHDDHLPLLTVRETLQFSQTSMVDSRLATPELKEVMDMRVENLLRILGLSNAADTILGNDLLRGVSGGERKRVTVAEMLTGTYRCLFFGQLPVDVSSFCLFCS